MSLDSDRFDKHFRQSHTGFRTMFRLTIGAMVIIFLLILAMWGVGGCLAFVGIDAISNSDPKEVARSIGEVVKSFNEGVGK